MRKISTLFKRGADFRVIDEVTPGCEWVLAGEGRATRKWDGTCCLIRDGRLYKRREVRPGKTPPQDFEEIELLPNGKRVGWVPVGDGPEDAIHRGTFVRYWKAPDGTYELCGPKINGNPEGFLDHVLIRHGKEPRDTLNEAPRTFDGLRAHLERMPIEGIVFHHEDGRRAKIKKRDFGLKRARSSASPRS